MPIYVDVIAKKHTPDNVKDLLRKYFPPSNPYQIITQKAEQGNRFAFIHPTCTLQQADRACIQLKEFHIIDSFIVTDTVSRQKYQG